MIGKNGWYFAGCLSVCNIFDAKKTDWKRCQEKLEQQVEKFNKKKDQVHRPGVTGLPGQPFDWESPNMLRWIAWVKQQEASLKTSPFLFQWQSCWTLYYELPFILAFTKIKTVKSLAPWVLKANAGFAFLSVRTRSWWNTSENSKQRSISFNLSSRTLEIQQHGKGEWWNIAQIIATSAEVTPNGGLIRELAQNPLNSDLGIIVICLEIWGN